MMAIPREWLPGISAALAVLMLAHSLPVRADQANPAKEDAFDSVMSTYTQIDWRDSLNLSYANLGNDQFLLDTRRGLMLWDEPSNTFSKPVFAPGIGEVKLENLNGFVTVAWARMGSSHAGTLVRVSTSDKSNTLLWWDGKNRRFSAALHINSIFPPHLLSLGPHHVLLCSSSQGGRVIRLQQTGDKVSLVLEMPEDVEARAALWSTGVVGSVDGFKELTEADITRPVYYDTSHCGWEIRNPPENAIKPFLDKKTRKYDPFIKPYFLADGRILLSEVEYFHGQSYVKMNPPLLWQPGTQRWVEIEHTSGEGGEIHRAGQTEPVMSHAPRSELVEFLDAKNMHWLRSRQRLPHHDRDTYLGANIEPLSGGQAVIFLSDGSSNKQQVGLIAPMRGDLPMGELALYRPRHDGEIVLSDGGQMLVGDGDESNPSVRSEIIDIESGAAHAIASLPTPLVSPYGLELKDASILIFGGRCPGSEPCRDFPAQLSYRYFPQEDRWQPLPGLKIPFTRGYAWQTGNSFLASLWPRSDAIVRNNGDVVWVEGDQVFNSTNATPPKTSLLKRWRLENQDAKSETVAALRKARTQSTLIELADGRLAVMGGYTQIGPVSPQENCPDCPDETEFDGTFVPARSTEVLDESGTAAWHAGPKAHYGGGRALKLANGRIFKLSLTAGFDSEGYRAEIADAAFTQWERLPPLPLGEVIISTVSLAGNRVLILANKGPTVVWDDDAKNWLIWNDWPKGADRGNEYVRSISALADGKRVLIRYGSSFDIVDLP